MLKLRNRAATSIERGFKMNDGLDGGIFYAAQYRRGVDAGQQCPDTNLIMVKLFKNTITG